MSGSLFQSTQHTIITWAPFNSTGMDYRYKCITNSFKNCIEHSRIFDFLFHRSNKQRKQANIFQANSQLLRFDNILVNLPNIRKLSKQCYWNEVIGIRELSIFEKNVRNFNFSIFP